LKLYQVKPSKREKSRTKRYSRVD